MEYWLCLAAPSGWSIGWSIKTPVLTVYIWSISRSACIQQTNAERVAYSRIRELNFLRRHLTVARSHIVAHATISSVPRMAQKDEAGTFSWVEFDPGFHSHSVKCACSLLGARITISAQRTYKKSTFFFILELFDRESEDTFFALKRDAKENCANCQRTRLVPKRARAAKRERT